MASMTINGVVSGMDWESMIDEIITAAAKPAQVQVSKKTNLQNKKSLFEEMKVMMNSLQSSLTTLKLPSTYKAKEIEIENLDGGSYKKVLTATVTADAEVNVHDVEVKQIATAQTVRSRQMTGSTIASYVGGKDKTMTITAGGQTVEVEVKASDSLQSLKSRINTALKTLDTPMNLTASVVDNKLVLKSDSTGLGQTKVEGAINGGYSSSGINSLKGLITNANTGATADISVTDDNLANLKISSGDTTYTAGTDYEIVNGNEIRWKQYEDTDNEIKLGKSISDMKYTMAKNDKYQVSGTYGTSEADLSALNFIDNGTLSSRVKIIDDDGVEYTYGTDFTIEDGKVVWLDEPAATNEPDSYTVSYTETETFTPAISATKSSSTGGPSSFTVSYTSANIVPSAQSTVTRGGTGSGSDYDVLGGNITFNNFATALDVNNSENVVLATASGKTFSVIKFDNPSDISLTYTDTNGDKVSYEYGKDFVFRTESTGNLDGSTYLAWNRSNAYKYNPYVDDQSTVGSSASAMPPSGTALTLTYTPTYTSSNEVSNEILTAAGSDLSGITITDSNGTSYTYGTDFTVSNSGEITWMTSLASADDAIADSDFAELENAYKAYYKLDDDAALPTVMLTDSDGIVRTYIDPKDTSLFTMTTADGNGNTIEYKYGRDYVIRVNDDGDGYVFSWAISSDTNEDGSTNILDANASVIAYMKYKDEYTTYGMKVSPSVGGNYNFAFNNGTVEASTTTSSDTINSTDTDKSLASILSGTTVTDYSKLSIKDSDGNSYAYGTDWTIDSSGNIEWIDTNASMPSDDATFTVKYNKDVMYHSTYAGTIGSQSNQRLTVDRGDGNGEITVLRAQALDILTNPQNDEVLYASQFDDDKNPTGTRYVYGTDWGLNASNAQLGINWSSYTGSDSGSSYRMFYERSYVGSGSLTLANDSAYNVLNLMSGDSLTDDTALNFSIEDSDGNTYTYGKDFTINTNGTLNWLAKDSAARPSSGTGYTLYYEAFDDLTASGTYDGSTTQDITLTVDSGYGNISNSGLSYEQILENTGLTSSSSNSDFAEFFSLTDASGNSYTYGTDYTIAKSSTTDSATNEHAIAINWLDDGTKPLTGATFTLTYSDSETMELTDAVTRSAQDTIIATSTVMPSYGLFSTADSIRITDGTNIYYSGIDFTVDIDAYSYRNGQIVLDENNNFLGNAVIKWNTNNVGEPNYLTRFEDASSVIITASDGTTYSLEDGDFDVHSYGENGNAIIVWDNDVSSELDSSLTYTVTAVKDGITKTYDLNSDLKTMTQRAAWLEDEASDSYDIIVSNNGINYTFTGTRNNDELEILPNGLPELSDFEDGTVTITQGTKTFYDGVDFTIEEDDNGNAVVQWITDSNDGFEWFYPNSGSTYTINLTDDDGNVTTYTASRNNRETLDMSDYGFTAYNGSISVKTTDDGGNEVYIDASASEVATDSSGNVIYQQVRKSRQVPDLDEDGDYQFDGSGNIIYKTEYYYEDAVDEDGNKIPVINYTGSEELEDAYSFNVSNGTTASGNTLFNFNWLTPSRTSRTDLPAYGAELNVVYEYDANTFTLGGTDDVLDDLGLDESYWYNSDGSENNAYYTGAHNAIFDLNGEEIQRDTNDIGESYGNEIEELKGVTLHLKGVGSVSLDISQDAEKAVEAINTLKDNYNDLMSWMNTRLTESQVDEDTASTVDSDDFRMRWGLLHGNSLLRNTKSQMRNIIAQNFTYTFTQRTSSNEIYGTMANNGLRADATLRLRVGSIYSDLTISPYQTLQDIVDMINDSTNPAMRNIYYDSDGNLRDQPLLKAAVVDDKLQITSTSDDAISVSGTSALNALKMNYTYKGIYQLGIGVNASADLSSAGNSGYTADLTKAKSGEIEFNESKFMEALEDNPDEVQELMLMFVGQMDSWCKSMLTSSGETTGTLTRQINDIDTQIKSIDEYLEKYQDRLDRQEESLRSKFTAAESQIAKLSQQANSIASILNMLNGSSNSGSGNYTAQT